MEIRENGPTPGIEYEEAEEVAEVDPNAMAETAAYMYSTFADMDIEIMSAKDKKRVQEIRRMSLEIAYHYIKKVHYTIK